MDATLQDTLYGRILAGLVTRLQAISTANGFHVDVLPTSVQTDPVNLFNVDPSQLPLLLVEPMHDAAYKRRWLPADQVQDDWPVLITARVDATGTDPYRKMALALNVFGDVETALTHDPNSAVYPGAGSKEVTLGLPEVIDLRVQPLQPPPIPGFDNDQKVFVLVEVVAKFLRTYGVP